MLIVTGKSTIALLLERFYDIDSGSITIDGVNVNDVSPKWLRGRCIGFISQVSVGHLIASSIVQVVKVTFDE